MTASSTQRVAPVRGNRQRERTRRALLEAGQKLFGSRPFEAITIDDIVAAADVAKASLYNHFEDKNALAEAVYQFVRSDIDTYVLRTNSGVSDPPMRIARGLCAIVRYAGEHPQRAQALLSLAERGSATNSVLEEDLRRGWSEGRLAHFTTAASFLTVAGLVNATVRYVMSAPSDVPIVKLAAEMAASTLRALGVVGADASRCGDEAADSILGLHARA